MSDNNLENAHWYMNVMHDEWYNILHEMIDLYICSGRCYMHEITEEHKSLVCKFNRELDEFYKIS